jgi:peptidoglycan/LPS O-acetylase OafA/YrhL
MHLPPDSKTRSRSLDSVRGIAQLAVVLCHCWLLNPPAIIDNAHPGFVKALGSLSGFFFYLLSKLSESGHSVVNIFYVLSGFVLAVSLEKNPLPYRSYATKRILRIYPTFFFVILTSYTLHLIIGAPHEVASTYLKKGVINPDLSLLTLIKNLTMFGTADSIGLDGVMWTLVHEMRLSLILPLMLLPLKRFRAATMLACFSISLACNLYMLDTTGTVVIGYMETTFSRSLVDSGFFIAFFAAGAWLALERDNVARTIGRLPGWGLPVLYLVTGYCLLKSDDNNHTIAGAFNDYIHGIGAVGLIALALGAKSMKNALNHRVLIWLGRISYSLYLIHTPILYVVNQTIGASWSALKTSLIFVPLSIAAAAALAEYIEFPSVELGKKLSARLARFMKIQHVR